MGDFNAASASFQSSLPVWGATPFVGAQAVKVAFQSSLPVWGATFALLHHVKCPRISILAPRVGSDVTLVDFQLHGFGFQSSLPVWGATILLIQGF